MKTLIIVRHSEASWDNPDLSDHERPLINEGINNAKNVAAYLCEKKISVDKIISSSAVRTKETAKIFAAVFDFPQEKIELKRELYLADVNGIFDVLFSLDDKLGSVMIFGHNPDFNHNHPPALPLP